MNKNIEKLLKLSQENPELEILCRVEDEIFSGEYGWYLANICNVEINEYYTPNETVFIDNKIIDQIACEEEDKEEYELAQDEDFDNIINKIYEEKKKNGEIKKAIFITISL